MKKPKPDADGGSGGAPLPSCPLTQHLPALAEFLADDRWDDGTLRVPGTLLICCSDGLWKAWLNDKDGGRSAWMSGRTLTGLLDALQDGLQGSCVEWRQAKPMPGRQRGK
jgi:hypothetical protein